MPQSESITLGNIQNIINSPLFLVVLALYFPPLPVVICRGFSVHLIINILLCILGELCILGTFPGLFHSWYITLRTKTKQEKDSYLSIVEEHSYDENQSTEQVSDYGAIQHNIC